MADEYWSWKNAKSGYSYHYWSLPILVWEGNWNGPGTWLERKLWHRLLLTLLYLVFNASTAAGSLQPALRMDEILAGMRRANNDLLRAMTTALEFLPHG